MARKLELDLVAKSNADVVLNRARTAANNFATDLGSKFAASFGAMALLDKGLAMVQQGFDFVANSVKKYSDIADQAQKAGMDGEDFQRLASAAELAGVSMMTVGKAARELRILMKDAAGGNVIATQKLAALGFAGEDIRNGNVKSTDVFLQLAKAMETAGNDAEKLAILTAIFGDKVSADLLPLLDQTRAKLRQTFGDTPIMDNQSLKDLDDANDKLHLLKQNLQLIAATAAHGAIFGKGGFGAIADMTATSIGPVASGSLSALQSAANSLTAEKPTGTDTGPGTNNAALSALGSKIGEASLGSGIIGVGASPQIVALTEQTDVLKNIDSKLGQLVNDGILKDPTKPLNRAFPLYSPGMSR